MPGIFGLIRKSGNDRAGNDAIIKLMAARLSHNELYKCEIHVDDWFALGNIALPVKGEERFRVDSNSGMASAFSGYIYGWKGVESALSVQTPGKALRIIDIYKKHGRSLPEKVDGSFNIAVFNQASREALICNDKLGHRHLFYFEDEDLFLFATEIKAFLAYDGFAGELDWDAAADFFNYGYLLGNKTLFKNARLFMGGHLAQVKSGQIKLNRYWDYLFGDATRQSLSDLIDEIDHIYPDIIRRQTEGARYVIIPLSGGLDSRFITGHAVRAGIEPHSFTHGRRGCSDQHIASLVAATLGIKNFRFIEIDPFWLINYTERFVFLSEGMLESSPGILMGISGQYGLPPLDTSFVNGIFGGQTNFGASYFNMSDAVSDLTMDEKIRRVADDMASSPAENYYSFFKENIGKSFKARFHLSIAEELQNHLGVSDLFCHQLESFVIRNRIARLMNGIDCNRFLWHDHFGLADDRLNEFFIKLPNELKPKRLFLKEYFKAKFPDLARIPYQATGVDLYSTPSKFKLGLNMKLKRFKYLAERASRGRLRFYDRKSYTHYDQWYRAHKKIRGFYEGILLDPATIRRGYYDRLAVERLLKRENEGGDSFYTICHLATFELFNRLFIDSK